MTACRLDARSGPFGVGLVRIAVLTVACLAVSSCGVLRSNPFARATSATGLPYRAHLEPAARGGAAFAVTVAAPGAPLAAFRESARFPATRYCLRLFGNSEIDWQRDTAGGDWAVRYGPDGRPAVAGRCSGR